MTGGEAGLGSSPGACSSSTFREAPMSNLHLRVKKSHVLIVDEDCDTADSAATILGSLGFQVSPAYDAETALQIAQVHPPEAVLLDAAMPGRDGSLLARELRQLPGMENALLICISGYDGDEHFRQSGDAGCQYHFLKPVNWKQLVRVLDKDRILTPAYA
jgi:CheY-like chemotaxis protein